MMRSSKDEEGDRDTQIIHSKRSLRTLPPLYAPSLVFTHGKKFREQTFCTLSDGCYHVRSIPEMRQMRCVASCYGWLIMQSYSKPSQCYLFNPISLTKIHLPQLGHSSFLVGVLTSSPIDTNCMVLLASTVRNSFVCCHIGDDQWIEKDFGPKTIPWKFYLFTRLLFCKEKIYLFCEEGMFVIDVHYPTFTTKFHKREWSDDLSRPQGSLIKHFFVDSCGEIFHVMVNYFLASSKRVIETLDVLRLEVSTMAWVQVESLGDRIFLLGTTSSAAFSSTELGMKGNCIYFCTDYYTTLHKFDMDDGTVTTTLPCPKHFSYWDRPFWVLPNCKLQVKNEAAKLDEVIYNRGDGKELPIELAEMISSGSFLGDCIRFRLICKSWISVTPPLRPFTSLIQTEFGSQQLPWLLSIPKNKKGLCNLYHPIYNDAYTMNISHELAGAVVRCAKYGWLLMSQGKTSLFFFNPLSKETIQLPYSNCDYVNISFSSTPTSPDCVVFAHFDYVIMEVYRKSEKKDTWTWKRYWVQTAKIFEPAHCSPVFYDGVFYSMGIEGNLGILNPNDTDRKKMWRVVPNTFAREVNSSLKSSVRSFIMEYDGEILSVIVGHLGKPVWVYKLDRSKMKWIKLESLDDKVIYLSHTGSIVVPVGLKGIENRIYLPRFQGRDIVYYSLSTGKYHCFGGKVLAEDWINTSEQLDCTWIQIKRL